MKKARIKTVAPRQTHRRPVTDRGQTPMISPERLKQLAFFSALLLVLAALLNLYVAWEELSTPGDGELVI